MHFQVTISLARRSSYVQRWYKIENKKIVLWGKGMSCFKPIVQATQTPKSGQQDNIIIGQGRNSTNEPEKCGDTKRGIPPPRLIACNPNQWHSLRIKHAR